MRRILVLSLLGLLVAACAPVADGELYRLNQKKQDIATHMEDRQDFRTERQHLPSFLLP